MKKLLAIGLASCLPMGLAAEDPPDTAPDPGTVDVLVIQDSAPVAGTDSLVVHRAVLTARVQKVSARERSRWM